MTLNYQMIVEQYPKSNGVVGGSIPVKPSLYLTEKLIRWFCTSLVPKKGKKEKKRKGKRQKVGRDRVLVARQLVKKLVRCV